MGILLSFMALVIVISFLSALIWSLSFLYVKIAKKRVLSSSHKKWGVFSLVIFLVSTSVFFLSSMSQDSGNSSDTKAKVHKSQSKNKKHQATYKLDPVTNIETSYDSEMEGDQVITGDDYTYDDYAYNNFYQVIIKANAVQVYTLPKGNLTKEKKLAHDTTLTVLETKKIDGQVWYRIGTNRWIMAATTIKVGELENFKLKRLSKKTKTTATVWVNKLAIYNNVNGKMTKKHLTRGTKVRIYAIATVNGGEWYKIGKNKWIPAAGVHELTVEPL